MDPKSLDTCSSCGARIEPNAKQCALCGWPVGQIDHDMQAGTKEADKTISPTTDDIQDSEVATDDSGPFCHMCGWENPAGARFCSSCGTKLQETSKPEKASQPQPVAKGKKAELSTPPPEPEAVSSSAEHADAAPTPIQPVHLFMMVAAGALIVAALYMITIFSWRAFPEVEPAQAQQSTQQTETGTGAAGGELPDDVNARLEALEAEAQGLTGEALILKKREMVSILSSINRPDKAAAIQEEIAGLAGTSDDWFQAGHFFYDWMDAQSGQVRFDAAQKAVSAYEQGLALNPDDLNIRTALAMAYLNTRAPMQGVQQIRQVLDTDPDHIQGNFYYGVMLMQINRLDQAKTQFQKVKELVDPNSALYQQAEMMLQNLN